jgi:hypothetical protein
VSGLKTSNAQTAPNVLTGRTHPKSDWEAVGSGSPAVMEAAVGASSSEWGGRAIIVTWYDEADGAPLSSGRTTLAGHHDSSAALQRYERAEYDPSSSGSANSSSLHRHQASSPSM